MPVEPDPSRTRNAPPAAASSTPRPRPPPPDVTYPIVSATSANALLSDLRPTTLAAPALAYINLLLDELLVTIIKSAESINPTDLRTYGIPAVFAVERDAPEHASLGALGRAAVGEAEVEIRAWYNGHPTARKGVSGYPPDGHGKGLTAECEDRPFPAREAVELMRLKVATFSTFAPPVADSVPDKVSRAWAGAGGELQDDTVSPSGLWLTAILEHICEHILTKLSQVVARDSSVMSASVQDLYTALCEDDSVYGFFKRMEVRHQLEAEIRVVAKKRGQRTASGSGAPRTASGVGASTDASPQGSRSSLNSSNENSASRKAGGSSSMSNRPASQEFMKNVIGVKTQYANQHKRSSSVLSAGTRQLLGAFNEDSAVSADSSPRIPDAAEEEFDAFIRSGETMRVSLTPSRFSTFENSPQTSPNRRLDRQAGDHLSAPVLSSSESSLLSSSTQASTVGTVDSRMGAGSSYRQVAGRSWSSATNKLHPRGGTIEEKSEDEDPGASGQSVIELLKSDQTASIQRASTGVRTVPAVILATPPTLSQSLNVPVMASESEPSDSPRLSPEPRLRSMRSASEGAPDNHPNGNGVFRQRLSHVEPSERRQGDRELADFLSNTAPPPQVQLNDEPMSKDAANGKSRFTRLMSRLSTHRPKDLSNGPTSDQGLKGWAEKTLLPSPSLAAMRSNSSGEAPTQLKSQRSASSFASGSTLQPPLGSPVPEPSPESPGSSGHVTPREVLRKPSLVRKWAAQVTASEPSRTASRKRRDTTGALPMPIEEDETESPRSQPRGLGISNMDIRSADMLQDFSPQGPEAALAQLTAASKSGSRASSLKRTLGSSEMLDDMSKPAISHRSSSARSLNLLAGPPRHGRVAELRSEPGSVETSPNLASSETSEVPSPPKQYAALGGDTPEGHIALAELVPLRNLLDNATTARECQLLLDAILSQFGVPRTAAGGGTVARPEDRVVAWLLAGREGPVGEQRPCGTRCKAHRSSLQRRSTSASQLATLASSATSTPTVARTITSTTATGTGPTTPASATASTPASRPSSGKRSKRKQLSPETMMKSLPALPQGSDSDLATPDAPVDIDPLALSAGASPAAPTAATLEETQTPTPKARPSHINANGHGAVLGKDAVEVNEIELADSPDGKLSAGDYISARKPATPEPRREAADVPVDAGMTP